MTCAEVNDWLGDAVDGTLDSERQSQVDAHCRRCAACRELLEDLTDIRAAAATLDRRTPSPELWRTIAAKTDDRRRWASAWTHLAGPPTRQPRWRGMRWGALASAAALMMMLGAGAWFAVGSDPGVATGTSSDLVRNAATELQLAEQHYQNAITALERLSVEKDNALDPAIAAEIAQSLQSIDRAIDDSRAALESDPSSFVAQTSLLEALRMKVALLQETVSLMNATS